MDKEKYNEIMKNADIILKTLRQAANKNERMSRG